MNSMKKAGLFFFLVMILEIPASVLVSLVQDQFSADSGTLVSILMTQGYLLLCAIIYMAITKTHFVEDLQVRKYRVSSFFLSLLILITASPMASWLNVFSQLFVSNEMSGAIFEITQKVPMWLGILIIGCLPGFIEETIYRGIIYTAFRKRSVLTGVIVSALSFGLMHMNFNQILYAVYLGIIFAFVLEATGSIVSTMILHMIFNAVNTSYVYLIPKLYEFLGKYSSEYANVDINEMFTQTPEKAQLFTMMRIMFPLAVAGLLLTWILIKQIAKINGRSVSFSYICGDDEEVKKTKPVNIFLILGWIFCIVLASMALIQ